MVLFKVFYFRVYLKQKQSAAPAPPSGDRRDGIFTTGAVPSSDPRKKSPEVSINFNFNIRCRDMKYVRG